MSGLAQRGQKTREADWATSSAAPPANLPSLPPDALLAHILPGMVGRGHGLETLCLYLAIARTVLLDLIVALGLPTPHDRTHRRAGGRNPWSPDDIPTLISLWMAGWHAASLGQRFGRSPGSIWAKARQLGLPRRDRGQLFHPDDPRAPAPLGSLCGSDASNFTLAIRANLPASTTAPQCFSSRPIVAAPDGAAETAIIDSRDTRDSLRDTPTKTDPAAIVPTIQATLPVVLAGPEAPRPAKKAATLAHGALATVATVTTSTSPGLAFDPPLPVLLRSSDALLPFPGLLRKGQRREIVWTTELDDEIAQRHWAFQHYKAAAHDMGISPAAMRSRKTRLELGQLPRGETVDEFNPAWAADTIAAYDYVKKRCKAFWDLRGIEFFFWSRRSESRRFSELARSKAWFRDLACA